MDFTASQIALLINGKIEGDANASVNSFGKIEEAKQGQLAFLANPKYEDYLYSTQASMIIINESLQLKQHISATLIRVPDAYSAFATLACQIPGNGDPANERDTTTELYCKDSQLW